jgi:hypothetical protein
MIPFVLESHGHWVDAATALARKMASQAEHTLGIPRATFLNRIVSAISVRLQVGNALVFTLGAKRSRIGATSEERGAAPRGPSVIICPLLHR